MLVRFSRVRLASAFHSFAFAAFLAESIVLRGELAMARAARHMTHEECLRAFVRARVRVSPPM